MKQVIAARDRQVSLSALALLFSELVQYQAIKIRCASDLECELEKIGRDVGTRVIELLTYRNRQIQRESSLIGILQFVSTTCWKALFGKAAESLERSTENENEYMVYDSEALTNRFISVPHHLGQLNCAAYIAGITAGILESANFPAHVTAHGVSASPGAQEKTVFLIRFSDSAERGDALVV